MTTVFYADDRGQRIGYAIVAGTPAPGIGEGGVTKWRGGTPYRLLTENGIRVLALDARRVPVRSGRTRC